MASIREEIAEKFGSEVSSDEKLLAECQKLCEMYGITPETLQWKWEAATLSLGPLSRAREGRRFTSESLVGVKDQIRKELEQKGSGPAQRKTQVRSLASGVASVNRNKMPFALNRNIIAAQRVQSDPQVKMELDNVVIPDLSMDPKGPTAGPSKVTFNGPQSDMASQKKRAYRYMFENTGERGAILDMRIEEIAELVQLHYGITELSDPVSSTAEEVFVVGRITHDLESPKLTELTLETSRRLSDHSGARIPVRFDPALKIRGGVQGAGGLGMFPGAIVALKGQNGGADWFSATEILVLPPLTSSSPVKPSPDDDSFSMYIGSGPFTADTDLEFKPWNMFMQAVRRAKPDVLVLMGPFVDTLHPLIKAGEVDETPLELFQRVFLEPLRDFLSWSPGSIVVLIPSLRDLISTHAVYPQAEFRRTVIKSDPRIRLVPNPCVFSVNGVTFGATSVDVLFHLRKEEVIRKGQEIDSVLTSPEDIVTEPISNACRHILQQRSFYPLFPVPFDLMTEVNLDITHSSGLKLDANADDIAPDVLILPSRYRQFHKTVHTTTAINPSTLVKGVYSTINVSSSHSGMTSKDRLKVEVVRMEE